jgi:hypothetical protein
MRAKVNEPTELLRGIFRIARLALDPGWRAPGSVAPCCAAALTGRRPLRAALVGMVVVLVGWLVFAWPGQEAGTPALHSG